ncbi:hypothetical protein [Luteolibacter luteus]|uniref:Uncharacterized protein n=1 Tax=Luteolibacter luteus TaxID=2728835 RepID=A0A858RQB0_9BACT|nr:hypothetical protein [Luteolibacter luteus]QJE98539.1 hypothetical protein HHL09_23040 [Luteolibacter luteus]
MPERNIARLVELQDQLDASRRNDALSDPRMKALLDLREKHAPLQNIRHPDITRVRDWESAGEGPEEVSFRDGIKRRADSLLETRALARIWCSAELQNLHEGMDDSKRREFALLLIDRNIDPASFATPEGPSSEDAARILHEMSRRLEDLLQDPRIPEGLFSQGYQNRREASRIDQEIEWALERTQSDTSRAIEEERMKVLREGAEERSRIGRMRYMAGER